MPEQLKIILWPDPRLLKMSKPVQEFGDELRALTHRMFELMREHKGVGLAAPQVGLNIRLFVMNSTGEPDNDRVYVNPMLSNANGEEDGDEGCLSLPGITTPILRGLSLHLKAQDVEGRWFEEDATGYVARIWQHEYDHLNGTLILDRMAPVARMASRKTLKDLEARYREGLPAGRGGRGS